MLKYYSVDTGHQNIDIAGIILCMHPASERWCYNVMSSFIGYALTQTDPYIVQINFLHPGLQILNSPTANAVKNGGDTAYPIYHSLGGHHFSATFVQFLSERLQDFGKGYHIDKSNSPSC